MLNSDLMTLLLLGSVIIIGKLSIRGLQYLAENK
jgi:hypothetical protein